MGMIEGLILTKLRIIPNDLGDILHAIKNNETSFHGFGEAYFSIVKKGAIKAWKRHKKMTLNLIVPCGKIKFVIYDDRPNSPTRGNIFEVILSRGNYQRLTIPPMVWMGFMGIGEGENILLNVTDIPHDPNESDRLDVSNSIIAYKWNAESE